MARARDEQHRYGQHYTPVEVARLLAAFAVRAAGDSIFDPACGDGRLLAEAIKVKQSLSPAARLAGSAFGIDRSAQAVALARETGARVARADFFDVEPGGRLNESARLPESFDAIIGNPPYIRQEVMGARDKRRIERRLTRDRRHAPEVEWPRWSGRSDIYVYFFARAVRFLRAGGRLAFLTASSWLDAGYGVALRRFLLNNFRILAVIESAAESFFAGASVNTSITVLEREPDATSRAANLTRFVQLTEPLADILSGRRGIAAAIDLARRIERADAPLTTAAHRLRVVGQSALAGADVAHAPRQRSAPAMSLSRLVSGNGDARTTAALAAPGWGKYLRADDIFFGILERGGARLLRLSELAEVRFGMKTGANDFFYLQNPGPSVAEKRKAKGERRKAKGTLLTLTDIARVQRGLTTGANEFFYLKPVRHHAATKGRSSAPATPQAEKVVEVTNGSLVEVQSAAGGRHQVEARFLAPVVFSLKEMPAIWLTGTPSRRLFFNCAVTREELRGTRALRYIRAGERAGYHLRPTCAARELWYAVTRRRRPAPLIFPSKVGERWLIAVNRAGVFEDKKLYGIYPRRGVSKLLMAALLNSTWARYCAEVTCRQMTGAQAIADIDVAVAARLMLPDPRRIPPPLQRRLETALCNIAHRSVASVFEEVKRPDRRRLDELVLAAIGFVNPPERRAALDDLYAAVTRLVGARIEKAVAGGR